MEILLKTLRIRKGEGWCWIFIISVVADLRSQGRLVKVTISIVGSTVIRLARCWSQAQAVLNLQWEWERLTSNSFWQTGQDRYSDHWGAWTGMAGELFFTKYPVMILDTRRYRDQAVSYLIQTPCSPPHTDISIIWDQLSWNENRVSNAGTALALCWSHVLIKTSHCHWLGTFNVKICQSSQEIDCWLLRISRYFLSNHPPPPSPHPEDN